MVLIMAGISAIGPKGLISSTFSMDLVSRSIMVPVLFHFEHAQDWLFGTGIELCSTTVSVPQQPFSALYARKVVAKAGVSRFLNFVVKI